MSGDRRNLDPADGSHVLPLPELPNGWSWTTIGDAVQIIDYRGRTPPFAEEGIPHLRSSNVRDGRIIWDKLAYISKSDYDLYMTRGLPQHGDVLFTTEAPLGEVALSPDQPFSLAQRLVLLRPKENLLLSRFLKYQIMSGGFHVHLLIRSTGSTVTGISSRNLKTVPLCIAPLSYQERASSRIEELFSDLDAGVAALERVRANLKRYRASVLKAAVEGRLTEKWRRENPSVEPASKLLERILTERRKRWEEKQLAKFKESGKSPPKNWRDKYEEPAAPDTSNLPELPKGWTWATVEQLIVRSEYGTSVKCDYAAKHAPVLRIPNIAGGVLDLSDMKFSTTLLPLDSESALRPGDLLMCRTNGSISLIGKAALVKAELQPYHAFASYLLRFRFGNAGVVPKWVHMYLGSPYGRSFIEANAASSAGQHNISLSLLHRMPVPIPPAIEQNMMLSMVEERLSGAEAAQAAIDVSLNHAARLRQSILKRAFEGKLVPQDPKDKVAEVVLRRIDDKPERACSPVRRATKRKGG